MALLLANPLLFKVLDQNNDDLNKTVRNLEGSRMKINDVAFDNFLRCQLAPTFGTLYKDANKLMDARLQVIIANTTKSLENLSDKSWENILSIMQQDKLLVAEKTEVSRRTDFTNNNGISIGLGREVDRTIINQVRSWFTNLIADDDVLRAAKLNFDIDIAAQIVATTGTAFFPFDHEYKRKTIADIGVLRFPDIEKPYFKLYRIKLDAWSDSSRFFLFFTEDRNGITGEFNCKIFRPCISAIDDLLKKNIAKAVVSVESLFD